MKIKNIGSNMTEVETERAIILVSYSTPVACCMSDGTGTYRTSKKWSKTTMKHINKWLDGAAAKEMPQEWFDKLV